MTKIVKKEEEIIPEMPVPEDSVESKLELAKFIAQVKSRIGKQGDITSDFTYAKLGDKDKTMIVEMTANAQYGKRLLKSLEVGYKKWQWNNEKKRWELRYLTKKEKEIIQLHSQNAYDTFMIRPTMIAILNRNVKNNYLIARTMDIEEEATEEESIVDEKRLVDKIKDKFKNEEE